jgi:regulatory protein YycI of two-component signal transduction system YycFG
MKNMEERLWDFIDGTSNPNEKMEITRLLETNPAWQKAYLAMLDMNASLLETTLEEPSMRFSKNVMEEIAKHKIAPSTKSYVNKKIIYGIAGFFLTLIAGLLAYLFTQIDFSQQGTISLPADFFSVKFSDQTNSTLLNIFLMVDAVLGLMLLDKYLQKRKTGFKQNEI